MFLRKEGQLNSVSPQLLTRKLESSPEFWSNEHYNQISPLRCTDRKFITQQNTPVLLWNSFSFFFSLSDLLYLNPAGVQVYLRTWSRSMTHVCTKPHTVCRTPLDEGSSSRRGLCPTTYNTHNRQTTIHISRFETAVPAIERPQTDALECAQDQLLWSSSPLQITSRADQQLAIYNKRKRLKPQIHPSVIFLLQTKRTDSHLFIRLIGQYGESKRKREISWATRVQFTSS
jgi:hypothetical protein